LQIDILDKGFVKLIDNMGNDLSVVNAARVSLNRNSETFQDQDEKLIKYLLTKKHTSPFEHVVFTFLVKTPLFIRSQWMRHRMWSYNEISRRYTSENIDFYIPESFRKQADNNRQASIDEEIDNINIRDGFISHSKSVKNHISDTSIYLFESYKNLIEQGVSREQARMILPQNMYTSFYGTVDLWNLLHFLELRNDSHAQYEMRLYAQAIEKIVESIVPSTIKIWKKLKLTQ